MPTATARSGNNGPMNNTGGDRELVLGPELRERIEAYLSIPRFAKMARLAPRTVNYACQDENPHAGKEARRQIVEALARLDAGEPVEEEPDEFTVVVFRPGVWVAVHGDDAATLGDLREVEEKIRRLADNGR